MDNAFDNLQSFLRDLHGYSPWTVVVELLLIGTFVFLILHFLQGTRGARMLRGIAYVLIGLYLLITILDAYFKLNRLSFLYGQFLTFAAWASVIAFQPELRRALMRLGESRLFRGFANQINEDVDALVETATFLSRRKIGAVVAIEREVSLSGIAENGTRVNADLTADLLETIFWPNSPLHDLGVVVSQGRIMWAGVQFPMAESGELERELGARHRAAVGMSQETDAVVMVVSEETGDISIAESGKLIRKLTPEALRGLISELLDQPESQPPPAEEKEAA